MCDVWRVSGVTVSCFICCLTHDRPDFKAMVTCKINFLHLWNTCRKKWLKRMTVALLANSHVTASESKIHSIRRRLKTFRTYLFPVSPWYKMSRKSYKALAANSIEVYVFTMLGSSLRTTGIWGCVWLASYMPENNVLGRYEEGRLSELFCVVLCAEAVHSHKHTYGRWAVLTVLWIGFCHA